MSTTTITFTLTPDEQRQLASMPFSARTLKKPATLKALAFVLLAESFLISDAVYSISQKQTITAIEMVAFAGLIPYIGLLVMTFARALVRKQLQQQPEMTWVVDEKGIAVTTGPGEALSYWRAIESISREHGFVTARLKGSRVFRMPERAVVNSSAQAFVEYLERLRTENIGSSPPRTYSGTHSVTFPFTQETAVVMAEFLSGKRSTSKEVSAKQASIFKPTMWKRILTGVVTGLTIEGLFLLIPQLPASIGWIAVLCCAALFYIIIGVPLMRAFNKSKTQPVPHIPWVNIRGLMTVTLLTAGLLVSWDEGSNRIGWGDIVKIENLAGDIIFSGVGTGLVAIPKASFLNDVDRNEFITAAEQYQRGETPQPGAGTWPPAPQSQA